MNKTASISLLNSSLWNQVWLHKLSLIIIIFAVYFNTLNHDYTLDDAIVIYKNEFTNKGLQGIPGILKYDSFRGFFKKEGKDQLVTGGRYRPLTLVSYAVENQLFGNNPFIGHALNIISYMLLSVLIYSLLSSIFLTINIAQPSILAFIITLLFALHPVHTEVVANIKGRDEIWALGFGLLSLYVILKKINERSKWPLLLFSGISIFLALLSKENAIVFGLLIPLAIFIIHARKWIDIIKLSLGIFSGILCYLVIRFGVIGLDLNSTTPMELMNNPFLKFESGQYVSFNWNEKLGTISLALWTYIKLLFWPHPLTHDYYPRFFSVTNFTNVKSIAIAVIYLAIIIYGIIAIKRRSIHGLSIALFLVPLLLVSNIFFPIGTHMGERFIFFSSLGWAMIIGWSIYYIILRKRIIGSIVLVSVLIGFASKSISRNQVWKDDFTLFTTDVLISSKSAKAQNAAAGAISSKAQNTKVEQKKNELFNQALQHAKAAIEIHPKYHNAMLIQGNCYFGLEQFENAIQSYQMILDRSPNAEDALHNIFITYREAGKYYGEKKSDPLKAINYLQRAFQIDSADEEVWRLMGVAQGVSGNPAEAIIWFEKILAAKPEDARAHLNLSISYRLLGNTQKAEFHYQEAIRIKPDFINNR